MRHVLNAPRVLLGAALAASAGAAQAHVTFAPDHAAPGAYYVGGLRVMHGCAGSATVALRVEIPAAVASAKPQPKAGWTLEVEREPLAQPVKGEGGREVRDRAKAFTWRGRLADDEFDTFGVMAKLPAAAGPLYFPTVQTCETGTNRWTDIPAPAQAWHDVPRPAPVIRLEAGGTDAMTGMPGMAH